MWVIDTGMAGAAFAVSGAAAGAAGTAARRGKEEAGFGGGGMVGGQRVLLPGLRLGHLDRRHAEGVVLENFPLQDRFGFRTAGLLALAACVKYWLNAAAR